MGKGLRRFAHNLRRKLVLLFSAQGLVRKAARLIGDAGCWLESRGALALVTPRCEKRASSSQCP
jgi:hypothetical protein